MKLLWNSMSKFFWKFDKILPLSKKKFNFKVKPIRDQLIDSYIAYRFWNLYNIQMNRQPISVSIWRRHKLYVAYEERTVIELWFTEKELNELTPKFSVAFVSESPNEPVRLLTSWNFLSYRSIDKFDTTQTRILDCKKKVYHASESIFVPRIWLQMFFVPFAIVNVIIYKSQYHVQNFTWASTFNENNKYTYAFLVIMNYAMFHVQVELVCFLHC